jgi:transposase
MKKARYGKEQREEALRKVREGRSVQSVSEEYGISQQTMYSWLNRDSKGGIPRRSKAVAIEARKPGAFRTGRKTNPTSRKRGKKSHS